MLDRDFHGREKSENPIHRDGEGHWGAPGVDMDRRVGVVGPL